MKRMPVVKVPRPCDCEAWPFCEHQQALNSNRTPAYASILVKQGKQAADNYAALMATINKWHPSANYGIEPEHKG